MDTLPINLLSVITNDIRYVTYRLLSYEQLAEGELKKILKGLEVKAVLVRKPSSDQPWSPEISEIGKSDKLLEVSAPTHCITLEQVGQTAVFAPGDNPILILSSRQDTGPVVAIRLTVDGLLPLGNDSTPSIITCCLQKYSKAWQGVDNIEVSVSYGSHWINVTKHVTSFIPQEFDSGINKAGDRLPSLVREGQANVVGMAAYQLRSFGIRTDGIENVPTQNSRGITIIARTA